MYALGFVGVPAFGPSPAITAHQTVAASHVRSALPVTNNNGKRPLDSSAADALTEDALPKRRCLAIPAGAFFICYLLT